MNKFPQPPPDRRTQKNEDNLEFKKSLSIPNSYIRESNSSITNNNYNNNNSPLNPFNLKKSTPLSNPYINTDNQNDQEDYNNYSSFNNLNLLKLKHIEDMRTSILNYKLLNDKKMFLSDSLQSNHNKYNKCNIILFGPSGSGKSSFIKTLYRSLYNTRFLPPEAMSKLIIKETDENEGTLSFTRLHLKEELPNSSGIVICDTRGHIWMNEEEKEQFKVMIEGKIRDNVEIKQSKDRSVFLLWEFWKKDSELFPKEIFNGNDPGLDSIPHNIVLVFDGSIDDIIDQNDEKFYRDLVDMSMQKGIIINA